MTFLRRLLCLLLSLGLGACASSPPLRYYSLDDGRPMAVGLPNGVSVAIMQVNLPELVDRPQLVVRSDGHRVQLSENDRWAEPLRRQVPRLLARDLGVALDSGRVVALSVDAREFDIDFRVVVDVQHLEVVLGQRVELDAVWRVERRNGRPVFGRSQLVEGLSDKAAPDDHAAAVNAERKVFRTLAKNIAARISAQLEAGDLPSSDNDDQQGSPRPRRMSDHQL
jgi:uncharacterized lipoprotein YmbA